jgi:hypothetical protein
MAGTNGATKWKRRRSSCYSVSKLSDAAFAWMQRNQRLTVSSDELWNALRATRPDLTDTTPTRKTPRTTCMRDLRKDSRFAVGKGQINLKVR